MPVIGTAGHVDHGKSTLVAALTGRDPDRWREEKERGLTIDLGFAWTRLGRGEVSFVDVPGHERFIKNMLAGTEGFDAALMAVAADEGWMPQSEEHLAALDALDVRRGVIALTKADRVDEDLAELAALEVSERLAGTSLDGSPIVPVSAVTGEGMERLRERLAQMADGCPVRDEGRPRLWVDRSFTVAGTGTVATGTLVGGPLAIGDPVEFHPGGWKSRIRSLQSHEAERRTVGPGCRTAVGLAGLEREKTERGAMLGRPGEWVPTRRLLALLRRARYRERPFTGRGAYQMHLGSGTWTIRLRPVSETETGEQLAVLELDRPAPVRMGDRFVVRDSGRRLIAGGGRVLEPFAPPQAKVRAGLAARLRGALDGSPGQRADALLEGRGMEKSRVLAAHSGGGRPANGLAAGEMFLAGERAARLAERARRTVASYHRENPLRPGVPKASLASRLGVEAEALSALLSLEPRLEERGSAVAEAGFAPAFQEGENAEWERIRRELREAGLQAPRVAELRADPELVHILVREGRLVRISDHLVYLPEQIEELLACLGDLPERFTVAAFRDAMGLTRKYAVPLLEWLDGSGATVRHGDERSLTGRRPAPPR